MIAFCHFFKNYIDFYLDHMCTQNDMTLREKCMMVSLVNFLSYVTLGGLVGMKPVITCLMDSQQCTVDCKKLGWKVMVIRQ